MNTDTTTVVLSEDDFSMGILYMLGAFIMSIAFILVMWNDSVGNDMPAMFYIIAGISVAVFTRLSVMSFSRRRTQN